MTEPYPWVYAAAFAASLLLTWASMPVALRLATRYGVVDTPGGYKVQRDPVPYLGGIGIVLAFSVAVMVAAAFAPDGVPLDELAVVMCAAIALSLMGLADDLRGLSPFLRLGVEIVAGLVVALSGSGAQIFAADALNVVVTVVWIVAVTNAFNLLDNMDGLSAGVAAIACGAFLIIALMQGQFLVGALAAALGGCAVGFLKHNFHPARIYMGDAGSLFLGFLLAVLGVRLRFQSAPEVAAFVPLIVLGVAMLDTGLVVVTRLAHKRNPLVGARDHVSHRLVFLGLPVPAAVSLIYAGAVALGWLGVLCTMIDRNAALVLMAFVATVGLFFGVLLGRVPVYANSKRRHLMLQEVARHDPEGE